MQPPLPVVTYLRLLDADTEGTTGNRSWMRQGPRTIQPGNRYRPSEWKP